MWKSVKTILRTFFKHATLLWIIKFKNLPDVGVQMYYVWTVTGLIAIKIKEKRKIPFSPRKTWTL